MQVAIGGGDQPDVRALQPRAAETRELTLFEDAQQLGLDRRRHLAHLVEEEHAAVGLLDAAGLGVDRAGERAALVAEQLRLEQLIGQRRAVDGDERAMAPPRAVVDEPSHDLLAGARFPGQQDGGLGLRHSCGMREHVLPLPRMTDHAPVPALSLELASERRHLRLEPRRRLAGLGVASRRLGKALMGQRERQMMRHAAREHDVVFAERLRLPGKKEQGSEDAAAQGNRDTQGGLDAQPAEHARTHAVGRDLGGDVAHDVRSGAEQGAVLARQDGRRPECGIVDLRAGQRVHAKRTAVLPP